ncbi:hypothetical protein [Bifidobacterium pseudocatenulatum]|nr:hypothetical protein [Bifidobacterium pseudocatenulatum]
MSARQPTIHKQGKLMNDTISKPTDEEETVPTAKTSAADADATVEGTGPERADVWRPSNAMNPWARAFDGDNLPDEPYMGSNKRPKQLGDMLPYPDAAQTPERDREPASRPSMGMGM